MGPVTVTCPVCKEPQTVPAQVVSQDTASNTVVVAMDATVLREHFTRCKGAATDASPGMDLELHQPQVPGVVLPGNRWCVGCGTSAAKCLTGLMKGRKAGAETTGKHLRNACCAMCHDGSTHPVPGAQVDCQVWAAEHGPRAQD